tara:strand:+ start:3474 stop:4070 length:597 start_codon:yes stop_codon:yes gene_type:complete
MSEKKATVVTELGKLCFDKNLFEANDDGKFQASMVIENGVSVDNIKKLMMDTAKAKHGDNIPKKFTWGIKSDKDADTVKYPFLENASLVSGGTKFPIPVIVNGTGLPVNRDDIKGGDTVRFSLSAYCYEFKGKHGVSLNVNAVLLVDTCTEEEAFFQKANASAMFGDTFTQSENVTLNMFNGEDNADNSESDLSGMQF